MSTSGHLKFQGTNRATFVGETSNIMFDTTTTSLGIGVTGTDHPSSNLYITGNAYVSSNIAVGGVLTMGTVNVVARHDLESVTATGNTTPLTVEFQNADTSLVTTGNVEVGGELTVSGNVEVGTANLFVDTVNSRVGIGTVSPHALLHVWEPVSIPAILTAGASSTEGDITVPTGEAMQFGHWDNGTSTFTNRLYMSSSGKFGVGTTSPDKPLHVYTAAGEGNTQLHLQSADRYSTIQMLDDTGAILFGNDQGAMRFITGYDASLSGGSEAMRILGNGNIGVGTNSPLGTFHISGGPGDCVVIIQADTDNGGEGDNPTLLFIQDGTYRTCEIGADSNNGMVYRSYGDQIWFSSSVHSETSNTALKDNQTERMRLTDGGRVGIGTDGPGCILDVAMQHGDISSPMVHFRANRDGSSNGDGNVLKLENSGNRSDTELLQCVSGSNTEFVVKANGNVGIGFNDPGTLGTHTYGGGRRILHLMGWMYYGDNSGDNEIWVNGIGTSSSGEANHFLWRFSLNGAALYNVAYIGYNTGSYVDVKTFTGQHRAARIENIPPKDAHTYEGLIVVADKNAYESVNGEKRRGKEAITTNEAVPFLTLSKKVRDKTCFGVISASEDPDKREQRFGNFVSIHPKEGGDTFIFVNSLGEGAMWVSNVNGALESGDFITTSDVPGYGMKQDDDILHNYTVAKITMDCDFNPPTQPVQRVKKILGEVKYWVQTKYINVTREEYDTLDETERTIEYSGSNPIYKKIIKEDSLEEDDEHTELDVRMEMVNDVDENGQMIWEETGETEKAYKIRYLDADGNITDEANAVHIAAFVGCTYHCG